MNITHIAAVVAIGFLLESAVAIRALQYAFENTRRRWSNMLLIMSAWTYSAYLILWIGQAWLVSAVVETAAELPRPLRDIAVALHYNQTDQVASIVNRGLRLAAALTIIYVVAALVVFVCGSLQRSLVGRIVVQHGRLRYTASSDANLRHLGEDARP